MALRPMIVAPVIVVALLVAAAAASAQQVTGSLRGYVRDEQGLPVPGTLVSLTSPNLMGTRTATADGEGYYRVATLPPGLYRVEAKLSGFAPFIRTNVRVEVGTTTPLDILLAVTVITEDVDVAASAPVIDVERTGHEFVVNHTATSNLPVEGRAGIQSVWKLLPGVTGSGSNPLVNEAMRDYEAGQDGVRNQHGIHETTVFIDGMTVNDPMTGLNTSSIAYEAIEEVNVKTAGFEAEFGSSRDASMQVVTKSGSNRYSGTTLFQFQPLSWNATNVQGGSSQQLRYYQPSVVVGGPILRDRLWFLGSWQYDWENLTYPDTQAVDVLNRERRGHIWYEKLTAQLTPRHRLAVGFGYDRVDIRNATGDARRSTEDAMITQLRGGKLLSANWTATLSQNTLFQVHGGWVNKPEINLGQGEGARSQFFDRYLGSLVRLEDNDIRDYDSPRHVVYVHPSLTLYPARELAGRHELKFGFEAKPIQRIERAFIYNADELGYYDYSYALDYAAQGLSAPYLYEARTVFPLGPYNKVNVQAYAGYAQDRWRPTAHLTINAGVRYEHQIHRTYNRGQLPASLEIFDPDIRDDIELNDTAFDPRVGLAYNLGLKGGVIRAHAGRFHERVGTGDYNNYPLGQGFNTYRVPTNQFGRGPEALTLFQSGTIPVTPDFNRRSMRMEYQDEVTTGYERQLPWNLALDATFIWRRLAVSESSDANVTFSADGTTFSRIDPTFDFVNMRQFLEGDERIRSVGYRSLQLSVRRNFTRQSGVLASFSRFWTSMDFRRFDPTKTYQFVYASPDDMDRTNYGPRWNAKVAAYYLLPAEISLSTFINATSGEWVNDITGDYAWNADAPRVRLPNGRMVADILWQARNSYVVGKQWGASGRYTDNQYLFNLRAQKSFNLGRERIDVSVDLYNLFNLAAYAGYETADVRRTDRYPVQISPQAPRAVQANVRYVF